MSNKIFPISTYKTSFSSTKASKWSVIKSSTASGKERSLCTNAYPQIIFNMSFPALNDAMADTLLSFYNEMKGTHDSFFVKIALDDKVENQILPKNPDGTYQFITADIQPVYKVDNVRVYVDGVETNSYTINGGRLTVAGNNVTATYEYYYKVRFDGQITLTKLFYDINRTSVKLVTVL